MKNWFANLALGTKVALGIAAAALIAGGAILAARQFPVTVTYDPNGGTRIGGGELVQKVKMLEKGHTPLLDARPGYLLRGWRNDGVVLNVFKRTRASKAIWQCIQCNMIDCDCGGVDCTCDPVSPPPPPPSDDIGDVGLLRADFHSVAAMPSGVLAVKTDDTLWGWGENSNGRLGTGTTQDATTEVFVMDNVDSVWSTSRTSYALKTDGSLWAWPGAQMLQYQEYGPTPTHVMDHVAKFFLDGGVAYALGEDGELYRVGGGSILPFTTYSNAVGIRDITDISTLHDGEALALKNDGSLWWWSDDDRDDYKGTIFEVKLNYKVRSIGAIKDDKLDGWRGYLAVTEDSRLILLERLYSLPSGESPTETEVMTNVDRCVSFSYNALNDDPVFIITLDKKLYYIGSPPVNGKVAELDAPEFLMNSVHDVVHYANQNYVLRTDGSISAFGNNSAGYLIGDRTESFFANPKHLSAPWDNAVLMELPSDWNPLPFAYAKADKTLWVLNHEDELGPTDGPFKVMENIKIPEFTFAPVVDDEGGEPPVNTASSPPPGDPSTTPTVVPPSPPEEEETFTVTFDLARGIHLGGGALSQTVPSGGSAQAPVTRRGGHEFIGWDRSFTNVTANITVTAQWEQVPPRFPDPLLSIETLAGFHAMIALSITQTEEYYNLPADGFMLTRDELVTFAPAVPYILYAWEDFTSLYPGFRIPENDFDTLLWETCFAGIDYFRTLSTEDHARFEDGYVVFSDTAIDMADSIKEIEFTVLPEEDWDDIAIIVIMNDAATGQTITWLIEGVLNDSNVFAPYDFSSITLLEIDASEDAPPANTGNISLSVDSTVYAPGSLMGVTVTGITQEMISDYAFVAIYNAGATHGEWQEYQYPQEYDNFLLFIAPDTPGEYEIRLYRKDGEYTDETFVLSVPFSVA